MSLGKNPVTARFRAWAELRSTFLTVFIAALYGYQPVKCLAVQSTSVYQIKERYVLTILALQADPILKKQIDCEKLFTAEKSWRNVAYENMFSAGKATTEASGETKKSLTTKRIQAPARRT